MSELPDLCPCNSQKKYLSCCEPAISGTHRAETPEALMRSRYTAYTMANIDYIKKSMRGHALSGFNETEAKRWAKRVCWIKLEVLQAIIEHSDTGYVEFEASFVDGSHLKSLHERSRFIREAGQWYYVDGMHHSITSSEQKITRNSHCPCGSQRKFKNCHGVVSR